MAKFRERECMTCGHKWVSPVVLSEHTENLSGEATAFCGACHSRTVVSSAVLEDTLIQALIDWFNSLEEEPK